MELNFVRSDLWTGFKLLFGNFYCCVGVHSKFAQLSFTSYAAENNGFDVEFGLFWCAVNFGVDS